MCFVCLFLQCSWSPKVSLHVFSDDEDTSSDDEEFDDISDLPGPHDNLIDDRIEEEEDISATEEHRKSSEAKIIPGPPPPSPPSIHDSDGEKGPLEDLYELINESCELDFIKISSILFTAILFSI